MSDSSKQTEIEQAAAERRRIYGEFDYYLRDVEKRLSSQERSITRLLGFGAGIGLILFLSIVFFTLSSLTRYRTEIALVSKQQEKNLMEIGQAQTNLSRNQADFAQAQASLILNQKGLEQLYLQANALISIAQSNKTDIVLCTQSNIDRLQESLKQILETKDKALATLTESNQLIEAHLTEIVSNNVLAIQTAGDSQTSLLEATSGRVLTSIVSNLGTLTNFANHLSNSEKQITNNIHSVEVKALEHIEDSLHRALDQIRDLKARSLDKEPSNAPASDK